MRGVVVTKIITKNIWATCVLPVFFRVDAEYSFDNGVQVEASDVESEGTRPVGLYNLAVLHREVVQRVVQVCHLARLVPETDELPVVLQDEVSRSPVSHVFS